MTYETKIETPQEPQSRWQSLRNRLNTLGNALDYDPQDQLYRTVNDLVKRVEKLEAELARQ